MKALSIQQPWAWLIANGYKQIENRTWPTRYRGGILIHAGKKIDPSGLAFVKYRHPEICLPSRFELGGICGKAVITDCVTTFSSEWFFGPFGFVIENAHPIDFIPCRGELGFFTPKLDGKEWNALEAAGEGRQS